MVENVKKPLFPAFINKYEAQIAEWSSKTSASSSRELHRIWVSRFNDAVRETRIDIALKNQRYIPSKWNMLYEELSILRDMRQISRTEGQKLTNKSMGYASTRSLRLLESFSVEGSSRSVVVDAEGIRREEAESGDVDGEEKKDHDEEEEENMPVVDRLYMLYYKKFKNEAFEDEEDTFLADVMNKKSCIQAKLFGYASKLLLKKDLDIQEDIMLKLSLSSIINMLQPSAYDTLKKIFNKKEMETLESSEPSVYTGLSEEDKTLLKRMIKNGDKGSNTDNMMDEILSEQLRLSNLRMKGSDTYKMLDILRYMIDSIDQYTERDSKLTAYRHFAKLLDCLFRETNLMLLDGEPACIAAKEEIIATHSLHPLAEGNALSTCSIRKIDAIIATEVKKERVELSTNEWKKNNVSLAIAFKQQSKNLRSNLSILNQLERKFNIQTKNILAINFLGYDGYLYSLEKKEGVAVATLVEELVLPNKKSEIEHVLQTINALFILKNHVLKLAEEVEDQTPRSRPRGIIRRKESMAAPCQTPRVMFSPKLKKKN
ncbi:hypothetical protein RMATCC62417_14400 [Rhizopus microsporus]|nr:hypothetical protein RMATCC62417_14400 [Rhizopus microsporus]